ncbi:unnamed protein product, partial [Iphiclides podalirius]
MEFVLTTPALYACADSGTSKNDFVERPTETGIVVKQSARLSRPFAADTPEWAEPSRRARGRGFAEPHASPADRYSGFDSERLVGTT